MEFIIFILNQGYNSQFIEFNNYNCIFHPKGFSFGSRMSGDFSSILLLRLQMATLSCYSSPTLLFLIQIKKIKETELLTLHLISRRLDHKWVEVSFLPPPPTLFVCLFLFIHMLLRVWNRTVQRQILWVWGDGLVQWPKTHQPRFWMTMANIPRFVLSGAFWLILIWKFS